MSYWVGRSYWELLGSFFTLRSVMNRPPAVAMEIPLIGAKEFHWGGNMSHTRVSETVRHLLIYLLTFFSFTPCNCSELVGEYSRCLINALRLDRVYGGHL